MNDGPQEHLAGLRPVAGRAQRRAQPPLDHTVDRLDLPALTVFRLVEPLTHPPPPVTAGRLAGRPAAQRRDQRPTAEHPPGEDVRVLAVVAGVGQQGVDPHPTHGVVNGRPPVGDIGARTSAGHHGDDDVRAAVGQDCGLGEPLVGRLLPAIPAFFATFDEVAADVVRLEAGAVDGPRRTRFLRTFSRTARWMVRVSRFWALDFFSSRLLAFWIVV